MVAARRVADKLNVYYWPLAAMLRLVANQPVVMPEREAGTSARCLPTGNSHHSRHPNARP